MGRNKSIMPIGQIGGCMHFSWSEFCHSDWATRHGLPNVPDPWTVTKIESFVNTVLCPIRSALKIPFIVTSGYRNPRVNRAVGGAQDSSHVQGEAVDFYAPNLPLIELYLKIAYDVGVSFDQLILEHMTVDGRGWIHLGGRVPHRRQRLIAKFERAESIRQTKGAKRSPVVYKELPGSRMAAIPVIKQFYGLG